MLIAAYGSHDVITLESEAKSTAEFQLRVYLRTSLQKFATRINEITHACVRLVQKPIHQHACDDDVPEVSVCLA